MVVVIFALAPDLLGAMRPAFGCYECETLPVRYDTVIRDCKTGSIAVAERSGKKNDQRVPVAARAQGSAAQGRDGLQEELGAGVEDDGIQPGAARDQRRRHPPVEGRRVPIEVGDVDALMDQVVV